MKHQFVEPEIFFINVDLSALSALFDLFDQLCQTGSVMRSIFVHSLIKQRVEDPRQTYETQVRKLAALSIPLSLRSHPDMVYFPRMSEVSLLDELLFWMVKYQIPERLLKFMLTLLTDMDFKKTILPSFLDIYVMMVVQWSRARASLERRNSLRLVHLSVQLFSNGQLAERAISQYHLLEIVISSLYEIFTSIKTPCQLQSPQENYHLVISEKSFSKSMYYWPLISDWINILSHPYASRTFIHDHKYIITWLELISWFQGWN